MAAGAMVAVGAAQGYLAGTGAKNQADYNQVVGDANAEMMDLEAKRIIKIGDEQSRDHRKQVKKMVGSQRVALAAQGVDVNEGSAIDIQTETEIVGARDAVTIQNNAFLQSMGLKTQAQDLRMQGRAGQLAADNTMRNSILAGGMSGFNAAGGFSPGSSYKKPGTPSTGQQISSGSWAQPGSGTMSTGSSYGYGTQS